MNKLIFCAVALVALGGCAKRPSAIVPADIPMAAYTNLPCEQLAQEQVKEQTALAALSKAQNDAANGDAFGVFLIGVPVGSVVGADGKRRGRIQGQGPGDPVGDDEQRVQCSGSNPARHWRSSQEMNDQANH
jgi:hypothetical protein